MDRHHRRAAVGGGLAVAGGLGAVAWEDNGTREVLIGAGFAVLGALLIVWTVNRHSRPVVAVLSALVPALVLTVVVSMAMLNPGAFDTNRANRIIDSGTHPASVVHDLEALQDHALAVADTLVPDGSSKLIDMTLTTDVATTGSSVSVWDDNGDVVTARLEGYPERQWTWKKRRSSLESPTFDGRDITLSYAPVLAELEERAQGIGLRPAFETVYIVPGHSAMQPLASANPRTLPVLEFRSHVGGRDITAQALADGTLPDTWFDLTDPEASAQMVRDALLLDDRTSPARLQTLTARTPAKLHESPSFDDRPRHGGVEFRGTVGGEHLAVTVGIGRFPEIREYTEVEELGYLPLDEIPPGLDRVFEPTDLPFTWQLRAERDGPVYRVINAPGAEETSAPAG